MALTRTPGSLAACAALGASTFACGEAAPPPTFVDDASDVPLPTADATGEARADPSAPPSRKPGAPDYVGARAFSAPAIPANLVVDGKLDEWIFDGTNAFVAIDGERVVIAISWDEAPANGVSIALGARSRDYPEIGWIQRAGYTHWMTEETCEYQQIPLIEAGWTNGQKNPPELEAACKRLLTRHREKATAYRARFVRRYAIGASSITSLDGTTAPWLARAKVVTGRRGVEAELPLDALPELAEAPLQKLFVASADGPLPELANPGADDERAKERRAGWEELTLEKPIGFGPLAPLLERVFPADLIAGDWFRLFAASYHPSAPTIVREVGVSEVKSKPTGVAPKRNGVIGPPTTPDRPASSETDEPLFKAFQQFGDVELGLSSDGELVTLVKGAFVAANGIGMPDGQRPFEKDLHLFSYSGPHFSELAGWQTPRWTAVAIKPDGAIVTDLALPDIVEWDDWGIRAKEFHEKDWSSFGVQGDSEQQKKKVVWSWDPKASAYQPALR